MKIQIKFEQEKYYRELSYLAIHVEGPGLGPVNGTEISVANAR